MVQAEDVLVRMASRTKSEPVGFKRSLRLGTWAKEV
jgi:hypothetical protein